MFAPHRHIPKYSRILILAIIRTPLLLYFAVLGNAATFMAAFAFYHFEEKINPNVSSYWDAAWWALCTVSTVGYGDIVPLTGGGRLVGVFLIVVGVSFFLGFMAVLVSVMTTILSDEALSEAEDSK